MEKITIYYGIQGNGIAFGLAEEHFDAIKELYKDAQPARGVFVSYDIRSDFATYHPQLEHWVFPALVGLANPDDLKKIGTIEFILTPDMVVTYTIEQTKTKKKYEQAEELVFG